MPAGAAVPPSDAGLETVLSGRYRLDREIARSNDVVYEATDLRTGRRVAIKELNVAPGTDESGRRERTERFRREARAASRLKHPNIVSVYAVGEEHGRHFIAMEFLEGSDLRQLLQQRGHLPSSEAIEITTRVLDALAYMHGHGVIHRDIKPDNIRILPGGQVKLTDFGIALLYGEPTLTVAGQIWGTPSYMSPEQIEGKPADARSDLFSLSAVLYEMLAGRKAFAGDSLIAITHAVMSTPPQPILQVPGDIDALVRRGLARSPADRPRSAAQMARDLAACRAAQQSALGASAHAASLPPIQHVSAPLNHNHAADPGASLPWAWNGALPVPARPAMPRAPKAPLLTQAQRDHLRSVLLLALLAVLLGGGLALATLGVIRGYDGYMAAANEELTRRALQPGVDAFNRGDYRAATTAFEAARRRIRDGAGRARAIDYLARAYTAEGEQDERNRRMTEAAAAYRAAISVKPADDRASSDLDRITAAQVRTGPIAPMPLPPSGYRQTGHTLAQPASSGPVPAEDPLQAAEARAAALLAEGDQLRDSGRVADAEERWQEAIATAPGTPEADTARQRLAGASP